MVDHFTLSQYTSLLNSSSTRKYYVNFHSKISGQHVIGVINSVLIKTTRKILLRCLNFATQNCFHSFARHHSNRLIGPDRWANLQNEQTKPPERAEFLGLWKLPYWPIRLMRNAPNQPPERADQTCRTSTTLSPWIRIIAQVIIQER